MKGKRFLGTKSVIIGIISAVLIGASATGVTVFLKNRDEARAAEEDQNRTLPITGWDEDGETVDEPNVTPEIVNPAETTEGEEIVPKTQTPEEEQTINPRENITRPTRQEIEEQIEETVYKRERKLYEDTKLSWTPLTIQGINVGMEIFKPNLAIEKKASVIYQDWKKTDNLDVKVKAGDIIVYEIKVSNSGNLEAKNVTITESLPIKLINDETELTEEKYNKLLLISAGDQLIKTNIPAKTETTFKIAYQVTQKDIDDLEKRMIANTVFAKFGRIEENDTDDSVEKEQIENYTIVKTAEIQTRENGTKPDKVEIGDKIKYTITVKNIGTVTLKGIKVVDDKINLNETINLTVGEEKTFEEFYTIKEKDILEAIRNQQGKIFNQATAEYKGKETLTDDVPTDVKTEYEYTVRYFYDEVENTKKAETKTATYQDKITTYTDKNITGYKFEKTENLPLTVSEKPGDNVIKVYYVKDEDQTKELKYTVEYYKDNVKVEKDTQTEKTTVWVNEPDTLTVKPVDKANDKYVGYKFDHTEPTEVPETINNEGIIKVYYVKDETQTKELKYTVEYYKDNVKVEEDTQTEKTTVWVNEPNTLTVNEEKINTNNKYVGYKFDHTEPSEVPETIDNEGIIKVYYVKDKFEYSIRYWYESQDGVFVEDNTIEVKDTAEYKYEITDYNRSDEKNIKQGYVLKDVKTTDKDKKMPLVITEKAESNIIDVYYVRNNFKYTVKYWTEKLDYTSGESKWELNDTKYYENKKFGDKAVYEVKNITGFTFDESLTNPKNATVPANNDLVINLYYTRNSYDYTVNFFIEGENEPFNTYTKKEKLGRTVKVLEDEINGKNPDSTVYEYIQGDTSIVIKETNNVINIYYKEIIKTAHITEISTTIRKTNLVLVIDMSSSMTADSSTRLEDAKEAANKFIDQIYNNEGISGINIQVITFNTKEPLKERLNYNWWWSYGPNDSPFSGTNILKIAGIDDNIAKNHVEAQKLKNAISEIYIPENYKDEGYGTDIYAALTKANEQITSLKNTYKDNDNVVVFLGDGAPYRDYANNDDRSIENISNILQNKSTVYCIRLGNEAQDTTVFNLIASNDGNGTVFDANTEGDLIKGFEAITSKENTKEYSKDSIKGIITIENVDLDISSGKELIVTKNNGDSGVFPSVEALNASGFISYNKENKSIIWNVKNYPEGAVLKISYHIK